MLAQLEQRPDVETAEVDRRGELLRIRTTGRGALPSIRDQLERMGFASEEVPDAAAAAVRWYGPSSVGELSREEGIVIASRVVPPFGAANGLGPEQTAALTARVGTALYECFIGHRDATLAPGGLAASCGGAVEAATTPLIGVDLANALARSIESDMTDARRG